MNVKNLDEATGLGSQVVQSYGLESLAAVSKKIVDVREFIIRRANGDRPSYKQIQQFPQESRYDELPGIIDPVICKKLYGKKADLVRKRLVDRGYCSPLDEDRCALSWRFRNATNDDFTIGLGEKADTEIYRSLDVLLWTPLPNGRSIDEFIKKIRGDITGSDSIAHQIDETEFWYRQGISIVAVRFTQAPSPELLSLVSHKLDVIQQEKIQNYFHIIGSFNADATMWMNESDRRRRFFEIVEHLLAYTWRPFDMETCEVSIDAAGDEGLIASGFLRVDFSETGSMRSQFDHIGRRFDHAPSGGKEFSVNDVALRAAEIAEGASSLNLRLVSRSSGNVDPRQNILTHRFVKLFVEAVGKLIDVIMPVIRREEAVRNLRWRSFLDTHRLRTLEHGEDLHRIINDSVKVMEKFFGVSNVKIFSEDREIEHMLDLFARNDINSNSYSLVNAPLSPAEILQRQLMFFPIREIPGGRILLYFELPRTGKRPLNPEIPDQYLAGTGFSDGVNEEATLLGIGDLKDYLFFMVTECLTPNPKAVLSNLYRRLPVRGGGEHVDQLAKLTRRIVDRFSRFFDLFGSMSGSIESGLAYMRGRRDNLTGLYNRQHFKSLLNEDFARTGYRFGLMFIDMDNFKIFNDAVSHDFGDKILNSLANRMIDAADRRQNAVPGRFGGDEFCFSVGEVNIQEFEEIAVDVFKKITEQPLVVSFYLDDRSEGAAMEINTISFLHRLMRPDVGSRQASRTEYVEKPNISPREHVVDIWKHYRILEGESLGGLTVKAETIITDISESIEDKILYNKIFSEIDPELSKIIRLFVTLQMKDYTTNRIRDYLVSDIGRLSIERSFSLKISAGLAHSDENRLRSTESLFKAADGRAYLAKHNGRNCLFGVDGQQLA